MTSNNNKYVVFTKDLLEECLKELASALKKRTKKRNLNCELIIVGGASIILNYGFRNSTSDIDCTDKHRVLMNDITNNIAEKHHLPFSWINTDFMNSNSYSPKLDQYSSFYKSYGNGTLNVRTIKDEYLLAMKVMSGRKYKNDYSDIYGIIISCKDNGKTITLEMLKKAVIDLYDSLEKLDKNAFEFAKKIIENPNSVSYDEIRKMEQSNEHIIKAKLASEDEQADIDYILSKLEIS